jgi:8-oxo-dGTP diphosphatase
MIPKLFVATKAFIKHEGKILVIRESSSYTDSTQPTKFDVVGGRVEPGENHRDALVREVKEETGLTITSGEPFYTSEWHPTVRGESWQIIGIFFECSSNSSEVTLSKDHDVYKWIDPKDYKNNQIIDNLHQAFEAYLKLKV